MTLVETWVCDECDAPATTFSPPSGHRRGCYYYVETEEDFKPENTQLTTFKERLIWVNGGLRLCEWLVELGATPTTVLVANILLYHRNQKTGRLWPSAMTIAKRYTGLSDSTVRRAFAWLREHNVIKAVGTDASGSTIYIFTYKVPIPSIGPE